MNFVFRSKYYSLTTTQPSHYTTISLQAIERCLALDLGFLPAKEITLAGLCLAGSTAALVSEDGGLPAKGVWLLGI